MANESEKIILEKLNSIQQQLETINSGRHAPTRIPLKDFCAQRAITRPTVYNWSDRGLIQLEKVGGRQYVKADSITITAKYQRELK